MDSFKHIHNRQFRFIYVCLPLYYFFLLFVVVLLLVRHRQWEKNKAFESTISIFLSLHILEYNFGCVRFCVRFFLSTCLSDFTCNFFFSLFSFFFWYTNIYWAFRTMAFTAFAMQLEIYEIEFFFRLFWHAIWFATFSIPSWIHPCANTNYMHSWIAVIHICIENTMDDKNAILCWWCAICRLISNRFKYHVNLKSSRWRRVMMFAFATCVWTKNFIKHPNRNIDLRKQINLWLCHNIRHFMITLAYHFEFRPYSNRLIIHLFEFRFVHRMWQTSFGWYCWFDYGNRII